MAGLHVSYILYLYYGLCLFKMTQCQTNNRINVLSVTLFTVAAPLLNVGVFLRKDLAWCSFRRRRDAECVGTVRRNTF